MRKNKGNKMCIHPHTWDLYRANYKGDHLIIWLCMVCIVGLEGCMEVLHYTVKPPNYWRIHSALVYLLERLSSSQSFKMYWNYMETKYLRPWSVLC